MGTQAMIGWSTPLKKPLIYIKKFMKRAYPFNSIYCLYCRHNLIWLCVTNLHSDFYSVKWMRHNAWDNSCTNTSYHVYLNIRQVVKMFLISILFHLMTSYWLQDEHGLLFWNIYIFNYLLIISIPLI